MSDVKTKVAESGQQTANLLRQRQGRSSSSSSSTSDAALFDRRQQERQQQADPNATRLESLPSEELYRIGFNLFRIIGREIDARNPEAIRFMREARDSE